MMIDGEAVWPGGGVSTAGTSIIASQDADILLIGLRPFVEASNERTEQVRNVLPPVALSYPRCHLLSLALTKWVLE